MTTLASFYAQCASAAPPNRRWCVGAAYGLYERVGWGESLAAAQTRILSIPQYAGGLGAAGLTAAFSAVDSVPVQAGASYRTLVLADSPVGYWRLADTSGTSAAAEVGPAGTYEGTVTKGVAGPVTGDTAVTFAGGDIVFAGQDVGGAPLFLSVGTVEAWVKTTDLDANYNAIFVKQNAYGMFVKGSGNLLTFDYGGGVDRSSGTSVADGQWRHVAMTFDSGVASGSQFYVDGVAAGAAFTMTVLNQGDGTPHIGTDNSAHTFDGGIAHVAVYATKLPAARILAHKQAA